MLETRRLYKLLPGEKIALLSQAVAARGKTVRFDRQTIERYERGKSAFVDFVELYCGKGEATKGVVAAGCKVHPGIDKTIPVKKKKLKNIKKVTMEANK